MSESAPEVTPMSELQDAAAKFHAEWCTDRLELCRRGPDTCEFYAELIAALTAAYARGRADVLAVLKRVHEIAGTMSGNAALDAIDKVVEDALAALAGQRGDGSDGKSNG